MEICRIRWCHNQYFSCVVVLGHVQIQVPLSLLRLFSIKTYEIDMRFYVVLIVKQMFTFMFNSSDRLLYILSCEHSLHIVIFGTPLPINDWKISLGTYINWFINLQKASINFFYRSARTHVSLFYPPFPYIASYRNTVHIWKDIDPCLNFLFVKSESVTNFGRRRLPSFMIIFGMRFIATIRSLISLNRHKLKSRHYQICVCL